MLTQYFHPKNWKINKGVIWLKIVQALWSLGVMIIYPFINLQMASLGLNTEDISLVNGLIPLAIIRGGHYLSKSRQTLSNGSI